MFPSQKDALTDVAERLPAASGQNGDANPPKPATHQVVTSTGENVTLGVTGAEKKG